MNKQILSGRLGADPESKKLNNDTLIANFTLATSENKEETTWHRCLAFNKQAQFIIDNLKKGSRCIIEGRLQIRSYENKDGQKVKSYETIVGRIEVIDWPERQEQPKKESNYRPNTQPNDGDIPF